MNASIETGHHAQGRDGHGDSRYALALERAPLSPGVSAEVRFQILGPDGGPVSALTETHEKPVHFIVVRRDLTGFWHLHPTQVGEDVWSVRLGLPDAGEYRVFADFSPEGSDHTYTVSADLSVAGGYEPRELPEPATAFALEDGYAVSVDGDLVAGHPAKLTFTVRRNGVPVMDLQPYLAAYGHLVAIRAEDLSYVHVHPDGSPDDGVTSPGPGITFHAQVAEVGAYRLFLEFRHEETVRRAAFTVAAR
jgi:hypothetical protein